MHAKEIRATCKGEGEPSPSHRQALAAARRFWGGGPPHTHVVQRTSTPNCRLLPACSEGAALGPPCQCCCICSCCWLSTLRSHCLQATLPLASDCHKQCELCPVCHELIVAVELACRKALGPLASCSKVLDSMLQSVRSAQHACRTPMKTSPRLNPATALHPRTPGGQGKLPTLPT